MSEYRDLATRAVNDGIALLVAHDAVWWGSLMLIAGRLAVVGFDILSRTRRFRRWRAAQVTSDTR
jgi:hypothetical protein